MADEQPGYQEGAKPEEKEEPKPCCTCCCGKPVDPHEFPIDHENGRTCSDKIMCIVFILFVLAELYIGISAYMTGDPMRLYYGIDYIGNLCGTSKESNKKNYVSSDFADRFARDTSNEKNYLLFYAKASLTSGDYTTYGVCSAGCPAKPLSGPAWMLESPFKENDAVQQYGQYFSAGLVNLTRYNEGGPAVQPLETLTGDQFVERVLYRFNPLTSNRSTCAWLYPSQCEYPSGDDEVSTFPEEVGCGLPAMPSFSQYYYCVPDLDLANSTVAQAAKNATESAERVMDNAMRDLAICQWWIMLALAIAMGLGFVFTYLMKICIKPVLFFMITLCVVGTFAIGYFGISFGTGYVPVGETKHGQSGSCVESADMVCNASTGGTYIIIGYVFMGLAALLLCVVCASIRPILKAIEFVKFATEALEDMPLMVVYPVSTWIFMSLCCIFCAGVTVFQYTSGKMVTENGTRRFSFDQDLRRLMWFNVFAFLWLVTFAQDFAYLVFCICFSEWYFLPLYNPEGEKKTKKEGATKAEDKEDKKGCCFAPAHGEAYTEKVLVSNVEGDIEGPTALHPKTGQYVPPNLRHGPLSVVNVLMPSFPGPFKSTYKVVRYYIGTVATGSLIVAIVKMIRVVFEYYLRTTDMFGEDNRIRKCIACCIRCCLACLEGCLKFITKGAYVQTAINNTGFCTSAMRFVGIILSNATLVVVTKAVGGIVTALGKLFVTVATVVIMWLIFKPMQDNGTISSCYFPLAFCAVGAYVSAAMFMQVYDCGIDTIMQCALEDYDEKHQQKRVKRASTGDNNVPRFMNADMLSAFGEEVETSTEKPKGCCSSAAADTKDDGNPPAANV